MNMQRKTKGFTIIEVVLVLAIAGLIFLMVFLALPALQRTQRDTQRKDDLSRFAAAVQAYKSNNGGKMPWTEAAPANGVISDAEFLSPGDYAGTPVGTPPVPPATTPTNSFAGQYLVNGGSSYNDPQTNAIYVLQTSATTAPTAASQIRVVKYNGTDCTNATPAGAGTQWAVQMFQENGGLTCQNL